MCTGAGIDASVQNKGIGEGVQGKCVEKHIDSGIEPKSLLDLILTSFSVH